jgi:hypothetical protein
MRHKALLGHSIVMSGIGDGGRANFCGDRDIIALPYRVLRNLQMRRFYRYISCGFTQQCGLLAAS